jgi:lipoprotein-releasing system permease protein
VNLPFFIAGRYLLQHKSTVSSIIRLAIGATAVSTAVMIVAISVVTGFKVAIREKLFSFMGHVHVVLYTPVQGNTLNLEPVYNNPELLGNLRKVPHVVQAFPFAERPVIVQAHGTMEGLKLKGIDKSYRLPQSIELTGAAVDFRDSSYSKQIVVSSTTANKLNLGIGDTLQIDFIEPNSLPRIRRVRVCGIYHTGMEEVDKNFALCDIRLLQRINNWTKDSVNGFQLDLDDDAFSDTVASYIHYNLIPPQIEAYTTHDNYSFIFEWLQLQSLNGNILLAIMTVVSVINLGSVLLILIVDRANMIGLLKALGMNAALLQHMFLYIAGLIAFTGILLGNGFALLLCWLHVHFGIIKLPEDVYYMKYAPVKLVWWHIAAIDIGSLAVCILCMWLPALYIRKIQPARVLQFK